MTEEGGNKSKDQQTDRGELKKEASGRKEEMKKPEEKGVKKFTVIAWDKCFCVILQPLHLF